MGMSKRTMQEEIFSARIDAIRKDERDLNTIGLFGDLEEFDDFLVGHSFDEEGFATILFDYVGFRAEVRADLRNQNAFEKAFRDAKGIIETKFRDAECRAESQWNEDPVHMVTFLASA